MKNTVSIRKGCLALLVAVSCTTMATQSASKQLIAATTAKKQVLKKDLAKNSKEYINLCSLYEKALKDKTALETAVQRQSFEMNEEKIEVELNGVKQAIPLDEVAKFLKLFKTSYEYNSALLNTIKTLDAKYKLPKTIQINYDAAGNKKKTNVTIKISDFEARNKMLKNALKVLEANNKPVVKKPIDINSNEYKNYVSLVGKYLEAKTTILYFSNNTATPNSYERMISINLFDNMTLVFPFEGKATFYGIINKAYQSGQAVMNALTALDKKYTDIPSKLEVTVNFDGRTSKRSVEIKKGDLQNEIDILSRSLSRINSEK